MASSLDLSRVSPYQTTMTPSLESSDTDMLIRRSFPFSDANAAASPQRSVHDFIELLKT